MYLFGCILTFLSFFFDSVGCFLLLILILEDPDSYRYKTIALSADKFTIQQYCEELTKQLSPITFKVIWRKYVNMKAKWIQLSSPHYKREIRYRTIENLRWLDWILLGGYLPSLSINYVAMSKDMEKRLPQLYYIKTKISYDLGFIAIGVAMAT